MVIGSARCLLSSCHSWIVNLLKNNETTGIVYWFCYCFTVYWCMHGWLCYYVLTGMGMAAKLPRLAQCMHATVLLKMVSLQTILSRLPSPPSPPQIVCKYIPYTVVLLRHYNPDRSILPKIVLFNKAY
jgi:hypothetical protein